MPAKQGKRDAEKDFALEVGRRLLKLRRDDETQAQFAVRIGQKSKSVISNWETGQNGPSVHAIALAVRKEQANPYHLLLGEGPPELVEPGEAEEVLALLRAIVTQPGLRPPTKADALRAERWLSEMRRDRRK